MNIYEYMIHRLITPNQKKHRAASEVHHVHPWSSMKMHETNHTTEILLLSLRSWISLAQDEMMQGFAVAVRMGATRADFEAVRVKIPTYWKDLGRV